MKPENIKVIEENTGDALLDISLGNIFFDLTLKINKFILKKLKKKLKIKIKATKAKMKSRMTSN